MRVLLRTQMRGGFLCASLAIETVGRQLHSGIRYQHPRAGTGHLETSDFFVHAFFYQDGLLVNVGTLGGNYSQGMAINNDGFIVGNSTRAGDTDVRAFGSTWYVRRHDLTLNFESEHF